MLKREFCVLLESKSLTEKFARFKSPLSLCARRYKEGYQDIFGLYGSKKPVSHFGGDLIGVGISRTLPLTASNKNLLGGFGVETISNMGGTFASDKLKK